MHFYSPTSFGKNSPIKPIFASANNLTGTFTPLGAKNLNETFVRIYFHLRILK